MVNWTEDGSERRLLLVLLGNPELKGKWDEVAAILGPDFVGNGIRQKYQKLKKEADTMLAGGGAATATATTTPASTKKKSTNTPKASTPSTNKGRKRNAEVKDEVESGDDEVKKTPSKKPRQSPSKDKDAELFNDEAFEQIRNGDEED